MSSRQLTVGGPSVAAGEWTRAHKGHTFIVAFVAFITLGLIIFHIDVRDWQRAHLVKKWQYKEVIFPCQVLSQQVHPYCWPFLPISWRIRDLMGRLYDKERIAFFTNTNPGVVRMYIPPYQWWNEALHGVALSSGVAFWPPTPYATSFPQVIGTSSSWNTSLWSHVANAIGIEARAFSNAGHAGLTFWTPNMNIFRDPRWGRGQETPGEDPFLTGTYSAIYVRGLQATDRRGGGLRISACCKHLAAYSLEDSDGVTRYEFDAEVTTQDLADTYLPAFRSCVIRGGASCVMCAYNAVNGVPMCANKPFLTGLVREKWAFDGYVTSDCDAVKNVLDAHNYTKTMPETIGAVMDAGTDINCGDSMRWEKMEEALAQGYITMEQVDAALERLLRVHFRLGLFDPAAWQPDRQITPAAIASPAHRQLALEAARQSIVLLKNDGTLPLKRGGALALVGPHFNATVDMQGNYFGVAPFLISLLQGLQRYASAVASAPGCEGVLCENATGFDEAIAAVRGAEAVVLAMGLSQDVEREALDRVNITLPGMQADLISDVLDAVSPGTPVVLLILSGGCVDVSAAKADPRVGAIVWAGYPGQSGGDAIADALFGEFSPAGRTTQTWYSADFVDQVSMLDMHFRPNSTSGNPGRGHRFYTGEPVYPFGWGLSYSTFDYQWAQGGEPGTAGNGGGTVSIREDEVSRLEGWVAEDQSNGVGDLAENPLPVLARVAFGATNAGPRRAAVVLMCFVYPPEGTQEEYGAPRQALVWFNRTRELDPGESQGFEFGLTARDISVALPSGIVAPLAGVWNVSCGDGALVASVDVAVTPGAPGWEERWGALGMPSSDSSSSSSSSDWAGIADWPWALGRATAELALGGRHLGGAPPARHHHHDDKSSAAD